MKDLSLHILDICENSMTAGASLIEIRINEDTKQNLLTLKIVDDGKGMEEKIVEKVTNPFYTTRTTRRVGLGFPLLEQSAKDAGGSINIQSKPGFGTSVTATFIYDHMDRKPIGDVPETIITLLASGRLDIDFLYEHCKNGSKFLFDTRDIKRVLQDVPINNPEILNFMHAQITEGLREIQAEVSTSRVS